VRLILLLPLSLLLVLVAAEATDLERRPATRPNVAGVRAEHAAAERPVRVRAYEAVHWRRSRAVGLPYAGRLVNGVMLPAEGAHFFTWDEIWSRQPNRPYRRFGTDRLIRVVLRVAAAYARAHPGAPRLGIADISRPNGGPFGRRFGGLGHASHQNGLDVDVLYPRRDRREAAPGRPSQIDRRLAQDLVDRFVRAGAKYVFVGPHTHLHGPRRVVSVLAHHDDHMHVRLRLR
jgi:murein endopeptidase